MSNEPSGDYVQKGYCRYAVFRIISFIVALLCFAFSIVFVAGPLAKAKVNNDSFPSSMSAKYASLKSISLSTYYLFQFQDYDWKDNEADDKEGYSDWDGNEGHTAHIHAMQAFGVLSVIFAAFCLVFVVAFFALLVVHHNARQAANATRDAIYEKARKSEVSHSTMRRRIEASDNRSFADLPRHVDDGTIYMEADEGQVRDLNGQLAQLREDENKRCKVDRAIGWVLLFCWALLFIFSLIAVALFAHFKLKIVKDYMNTSAYKDYSLKSAGFSSTDDLSGSIISYPYMAGFILLIIVVILSFVMLVFLAIQSLEGFFCCPRYDNDGIKDLEMARVDPPAPPRDTYQSDRTGRTPSSFPPPLFNSSHNACCSTNNDGYGMNAYTGGNTGNPNVEHAGAAYGIPVALPGPPVNAGATPEQVAESYYRDLGLPPPAYSQNSNNGGNVEKPAKKAA